jgi:hypothetical protein
VPPRLAADRNAEPDSGDRVDEGGESLAVTADRRRKTKAA